jgi:hypothetical protein
LLKINAYATDLGWIGKDLQNYFFKLGVLISEEPIYDCDRWICIRTKEANKSPEVSPATMAMSSAGMSVMFGPARFNG